MRNRLRLRQGRGSVGYGGSGGVGGREVGGVENENVGSICSGEVVGIGARATKSAVICGAGARAGEGASATTAWASIVKGCYSVREVKL
jgi:hypothetical protein